MKRIIPTTIIPTYVLHNNNIVQQYEHKSGIAWFSWFYLNTCMW